MSKKLGKCVVLIVLFTLFSQIELSGQVFHRLTERNGLPTNFCNELAQDSSGYMWIATDAGLVRYDGVHSKVYQSVPNNPSSLSGNIILSIHVGSSGSLWASTGDGILNRYQPELDQFERIKLPELDSLLDKRIFDLLEVGDILWMAAEGGLFKHHIPTGHTKILNPRSIVQNSNHPFLQTCYVLYQDIHEPDVLWIGTRAGLIQLNQSDGHMEFKTEYIPEMPSTQDYAINNISQNEDHSLWIGGSWSGVKKYQPENGLWSYYFDGYYPESGVRNDVTALLPKNQNEIWVASYINGLGIFNIQTQSYRYLESDVQNEFSVQLPPITKILADKNGNTWIAGHHGASFFNVDLQTIHNFNFPARQVPHALTHIFSTAIEKLSTKEVLIATRSGDGLYLANLNTGNVHVVDQYIGKQYDAIIQKQTTTDFFDLQVNDLLKVSENRIWAAVDTQMAYYDISKKALIFPEETNNSFYQNCVIRSLQLDSKGNVWGINPSRNCIFQANPITFEVLHKYSFESLLPKAIREERKYGIGSCFVDAHDQIWYHTYSQVLKYDIQGDSIYIIPKKNENNHGTEGIDYFNITGSKDGQIYLSSIEKGVQIIHPNQSGADSFQLLELADGLPIDRVVKVEVRDDQLWIATRKGLVKYSIPTGKTDIYDRQDGMSNPDLLNYWTVSLDVAEDGDVFFGNPDQFGYIQSNSSFTNQEAPVLKLTGFEVHEKEKKLNKNIQFLKEVKLKSTENFFSIFFASDQFLEIENYWIQYKLDGYNDHWIDADKSCLATFNKVPCGQYTFLLRASNKEIPSNKSQVQIDLTIATPFLKSSIFYALLSISILLFSWLLYRWRLNQIKEKENIKSDFKLKLAEVEMSALRAQMNPHFVFNSLNSINMYILTNEPREASRYLTKFSQLMRLILNNSKSKEVSLEAELQAISLYVQMEKLRFKQQFEFHLIVDTVQSPIHIFIPPMLIQPYIENAIWHGLLPMDRKGELTVSIKEKGQNVICVIQDSGIGRKKAQELKLKKGVRKKSMGMKITSDRFAMVEALHNMKTEIIIEDLYLINEPAGTKVTLSIPFRRSINQKSIQNGIN